MERLEKEIDANGHKAAITALVSEIRQARETAAEARRRAAKKEAIAKSAAADLEDFQGGSLAKDDADEPDEQKVKRGKI